MHRGSRVLPSVLLGIGFGGFIDGILLHQILQWHHMVSADGCCPTTSVEGLKDNTLADGVFHAGTWAITLVGSLVAFRAWRAGDLAPPWLRHAGGLIAGWGIFNLADSANHFLLGLHHIRDDLGGPVAWDVGFLAFALVLVAAGWLTVRQADRVSRPAADPVDVRR